MASSHVIPTLRELATTASEPIRKIATANHPTNRFLRLGVSEGQERDIGTLAAAPVAVTVTEQYDDWELIQGVQLWGTAKRVTGAAKAAAMAVYLRRFPFVRELMEQPRLAASMRKVAVYRVDPDRVAFTDNTTGVFGREVLDLKG